MTQDKTRADARRQFAACHAWLLIRIEATTRTYRCISCGDLLTLPRVLPGEETDDAD